MVARRKGESLEDFRVRRKAADALRRSDPAVAAAANEGSKAWRAANAAHKRAVDALWRAANPDALKAARDAWKQRNGERIRIHRQTRRARASECGGRLSADIVARLFALQRGKCANCAVSLKTSHLDHVVPFALGGLNVDSNVQLLCPRCNLRKNAKDPIDFAQQEGRLL